MAEQLAARLIEPLAHGPVAGDVERRRLVPVFLQQRRRDVIRMALKARGQRDDFFVEKGRVCQPVTHRQRADNCGRARAQSYADGDLVLDLQVEPGRFAPALQGVPNNARDQILLIRGHALGRRAAVLDRHGAVLARRHVDFEVKTQGQRGGVEKAAQVCGRGGNTQGDA